MSKARIYYIVGCIRHGKENKNWAGKQVLVTKPKSKDAGKNFGCPLCKSEATKQD